MEKIEVKLAQYEDKDPHKTWEKFWEEWVSVDWKARPDEVASALEKQLEKFGLKIQETTIGDDCYHFRIVKS